MRRLFTYRVVIVSVSVFAPLLFSQMAYADGSGIVQIQSFLESVIQLVAGLAGLIATGFFVIGGLGYITSSGSPERLTKAKRTLLHSGIGLAIVIGAFVISNIITTLATKAFAS
jgi:uncharacterized membrane-anchored protein